MGTGQQLGNWQSSSHELKQGEGKAAQGRGGGEEGKGTIPEERKKPRQKHPGKDPYTWRLERGPGPGAPDPTATASPTSTVLLSRQGAAGPCALHRDLRLILGIPVTCRLQHLGTAIVSMSLRVCMLARACDTNGTKLICPRSKDGNDLLFPIISWSEVNDPLPAEAASCHAKSQKDGD
ncbi:uncharacterized protein RHO17_017727 [Thomomys bottae]